MMPRNSASSPRPGAVQTRENPGRFPSPEKEDKMPTKPKPLSQNVIAAQLEHLLSLPREKALEVADDIASELDAACLCEMFIDREWVTRNRPELLHTWDWDEHPEGYEDECFCYECRMSS